MHCFFIQTKPVTSLWISAWTNRKEKTKKPIHYAKEAKKGFNSNAPYYNLLFSYQENLFVLHYAMHSITYSQRQLKFCLPNSNDQNQIISKVVPSNCIIVYCKIISI